MKWKGILSSIMAVADEPGGPYTATSEPLVRGADTWVEGIGNYGHHDIDPTVWIDTDEEGNEHRYLMWGEHYVLYRRAE